MMNDDRSRWWINEDGDRDHDHDSYDCDDRDDRGDRDAGMMLLMTVMHDV